MLILIRQGTSSSSECPYSLASVYQCGWEKLKTAAQWILVLKIIWIYNYLTLTLVLGSELRFWSFVNTFFHLSYILQVQAYTVSDLGSCLTARIIVNYSYLRSIAKHVLTAYISSSYLLVVESIKVWKKRPIKWSFIVERKLMEFTGTVSCTSIDVPGHQSIDLGWGQGTL